MKEKAFFKVYFLNLKSACQVVGSGELIMLCSCWNSCTNEHNLIKDIREQRKIKKMFSFFL